MLAGSTTFLPCTLNKQPFEEAYVAWNEGQLSTNSQLETEDLSASADNHVRLKVDPFPC